MEALKNDVYILNMIHAKTMPKNPFGFRNGRKPSLKHVDVQQKLRFAIHMN